MSFMRYQGMVYWFRSLVGSFCYAELVVLYSAWPGISVIMRLIQIPFYFRWFWYYIVERKNGCFIAQRCLNQYKIDKFCTIERKMEDIFVQRNNLLSFSKRSKHLRDSNSLILQTSAYAESLPQLRCGPLPLTAEGGKVFRIKELMN